MSWWSGRARPGESDAAATPKPALPRASRGFTRGFGLPHALIAALAAVVIIGPMLRHVPDEANNGGYVDIVNRAIRSGWLYPDPAAPNADGAPEGRVRWSAGTPVPPAFLAFRRQSFLDQDMESLDSAVWRYDGGELELDARAHLVSGSASSDGGWQGNVWFADTDTEQRVTDGAGQPVATLDPGEPYRPINLGVARTETVSAGSIGLRTPGADGLELARIIRVGNDAVLVRPRRESGATRVQIVSAEGRRDDGGIWHPLVHGDVIVLTWAGRRAQFMFENRAQAISQVRRGADRLRHPSLDTLARGLEISAASGAGDLRTTINRRLHDIAEDRLAARSTELQRITGNRNFRSAAVLMDGRTGEIRGLPTFPYRPEDFGQGQTISRSQQTLLERNSNFVRMPVGSTAKVPLAFAIINQIPQLAGLRIDGRGGFTNLLGVRLGANVDDHVTGAIDFQRFVFASSNEYAAMLMMLALSGQEPFANTNAASRTNCGADRRVPGFRIGNDVWNCRPPSGFLNDATVRQDGLVNPPYGMARSPGLWIDQLASLYCINPHDDTRGASGSSLLCGGDRPGGYPIWRALDTGIFARPRLLASVSPDREDFRLGRIDNLHSDYLMTILGGNRGRWTTIGLAQAYARIVAGRPVNARLLGLRQDEEPETGLTYPNDMQQRVNAARGVMLPALNQVVTSGTGRFLQPTVRAMIPDTIGGDRLFVFAKTGTANIAIPSPDAYALLQRFATAGCGLRRVVGPATGTGTNTRPGRPRLEVNEQTASSPACRQQFGQQMAEVERLVRRINASPVIDQIVSDPIDGRVTRMPSDISFEMGTGHMLVLLVGRYRADDTQRSNPCSLRVAAINFQARLRGTAESTSPALYYARDLLTSAPIRSWFIGEPCGQAQAQPAAQGGAAR